MQGLGLPEILIPFLLILFYVGIPALIILSVFQAFKRTWRQLEQIMREVQAIKMVLAQRD
jgi:hypothetical protein